MTIEEAAVAYVSARALRERFEKDRIAVYNGRTVDTTYDEYIKAARAQGVAWKRLKKACAI